jgi:hypothetical protein
MEIYDCTTSVSSPGSEPSAFSVVVPSREVKLRPDEKDLLVEANDSAVVKGVLVVHGHADVANYVFGQFGLLQNVRKHLPRVLHRVQLEEMVLATVA